MSRYRPTPEEIAALRKRGWQGPDEGGWWYPLAPILGGIGRTYREAVREQDRRDRAKTKGGKR